MPLAGWRLSPRITPLIDIRDYPEAIDVLNAIIANGGAAEVKAEGRQRQLVIVELSRQVKIKTPTEGKS